MNHGMEIFVCKLTGDFMSGIILLQKRNITVKEPLDFTVIAVTEKVIEKIELSSLWQRNM